MKTTTIILIVVLSVAVVAYVGWRIASGNEDLEAVSHLQVITNWYRLLP